VLCSVAWTLTTVGVVDSVRFVCENTRPAVFGEAWSVTGNVPLSVETASSASYVEPTGAIRNPSPAEFPPSEIKTAISPPHKG
jgi:hypothetical protein